MRIDPRLFLPCVLSILCGCSWDNTLYEKYVGSEEIVAVCEGECTLPELAITRSECIGDGLIWHENRCINTTHGTVLQYVKEEGRCNRQEATWEPAHCEVTSAFGCYQIKGEWTSYRFNLLDLGNGDYIRKLDEGYACGKYAEVLKATKPTACPPDAIQDFETSNEFHICPGNAANCARYSLPEASEEDAEGDVPYAMCSSCADGMAVCYENNKFQCVDLNTNNNHCGICGNKCESTGDRRFSCVNGQCIEFTCAYTECDNGGLFCINPLDNSTCGATCDHPQGTRCDVEKGMTCLIDKAASSQQNPTYKCDCASGIKKDHDICVNPASNETCGATDDNRDGRTCSAGLACRPAGDHQSYACVCAKSWEELCHAEEADYCIDPSTDHEHCGAKGEQACQNLPEFQCGPSQKCVNGNCECLPEFAACGDRCTDSSMDKDYCGARGQCNDPNPASENYQGVSCGAHAYCTKSQCACDENYIMCNNKCISPGADETCGAAETASANVCNMGQDCTKENRKSCQKENGSYQCVCDTGYVACAGQCIDPMTNPLHCGAQKGCVGGQKCDFICADGKCQDDCPWGTTQCFLSTSEKVCISQSLSHLAAEAGNCSKCSPEYCKSDKYSESDPHYYADRCVTEDNSNRLHTDNHCGSCDDKCADTYKCLSLPGGKYQCGCPDGFTECTIPGSLNKQCFDLKALHKTSCDTCDTGWADCNKVAADGCESLVADDKNNCGQCGNKCDDIFSGKHVSTAVCISGSCQFTSCEPGFGNCDGNPANGCEVNLMTKEACGTCSNNCNTQNMGKNYNNLCINGTCDTTCAAGFANCDNNTATGCETNISSDVKHCGSCQTKCSEQKHACKNSICCVRDNKEILENEVCCNKKYSRWSTHRNKTIYKCNSTPPNDGNTWTEVH